MQTPAFLRAHSRPVTARLHALVVEALADGNGLAKFTRCIDQPVERGQIHAVTAMRHREAQTDAEMRRLLCVRSGERGQCFFVVDIGGIDLPGIDGARQSRPVNP